MLRLDKKLILGLVYSFLAWDLVRTICYSLYDGELVFDCIDAG